jgi:hypothetical protein
VVKRRDFWFLLVLRRETVLVPNRKRLVYRPAEQKKLCVLCDLCGEKRLL